MTTLVLLSFSLSCGKSKTVDSPWKKILPATQLVKANVPNELMPGVNKNEKLYDELKSKQRELAVSYNGDNVIFSNDWVSFVASKEQVNEGFRGIDNFQKTFADAISRTIVTDFWKNNAGSISLFGDNLLGFLPGAGAIQRNGHSDFYILLGSTCTQIWRIFSCQWKSCLFMSGVKLRRGDFMTCQITMMMKVLMAKINLQMMK